VRILYEDEALLFVDKLPGMVVQRGYDPDEPVLIEQVTEYLKPRGQRGFLMQRLDRGTSGVIFFTKDSDSNRKITREFERKRIRKTYLALCTGRFSRHQLIDAPLQRSGPISFAVREGGKNALTEVWPLALSTDASLLRVELLTGRTHQIRVHLATIGHPLVGDWLYGQRDAARPMLHAFELTMKHPRGGRPLRIRSDPPADFLAAAAGLGLGEIGGALAVESPAQTKQAE
jgi:23S rRNA pseudouridine1911/1915/1917 synthase